MGQVSGSDRRSLLKTATMGAALAAGLEGASYLALDRYGRGLNSIPTVVMEEFPEINRALLEKYTSFNPELGWVSQPNQTKQKDTGDHLPGEEVRSMVTYSTDEYGSRDNHQLTEADALASRWHPKTVASARSIPFDLSLRIELCVERFANRYSGFPRSWSTVNRRVKEAADQADLTGHIYPHCLRATAASHHAYKGVAPVPLQALMGWSDLATAQKYIRISGTTTADALRRVHHR